MNIDIAMGVIEEIARKLGVPAEQIVPELSKMSIAHNIFMCTVMTIAFLILLVGIIVSVEKFDYCPELSVILFCFSLLVIVAAVYYGNELVCWIESPQAMTIEYVLQYMR